MLVGHEIADDVASGRFHAFGNAQALMHRPFAVMPGGVLE